MAVGDSNLAGLARVAYEAVGLADFAADNQRAESVYRDTTRSMSDEAIRLELAQDKLRRSLAKGPAAFREQARAELQVRNAERALRSETDALTGSQNRLQRELSQTARGGLLGTGAMRSLGRSVAFASASFLGGAGLVYGMRQAINVASNLEEQTDKTRRVFGEAAGDIENLGRQSATQMGIANDAFLEYASTLGALLRPIGIVGRASAALSEDLVRRGSDLASFYNRDVRDALEALRSGIVGESEPLRTFGVRLSEARVQKDALAATGKKLAAQLDDEDKALARIRIILADSSIAAGNFQQTSEGLANSQRTLSALWRDAQVLVGQALAPAYTDAVQGLRDWLSSAENQKQLQRDVNQIVGDGVTIVKAFADVLGVARDAAAPLVSAVGGLGNAIRIMAAAWLVFKAKAVIGFAGTALASRVTATKMVADAAVAGRAWDVATRPRVMSVTTVGGGAPVGGAPGRGGGRGVPLPLLGVGAGGAILTGAALVAYFGIRSNQTNPVSPEQFQRIREAAGRGELSREQLAQLAPFLRGNQEAELRRLIAVAQARGGGAESSPDSRGDARGPGAVAAENARRAGRTRSRGRFTFAAFESQLAGINEQALDAAATSGTSDDVRVERARLALARRALRELKLTAAQRMQVKQERNRALQELAGIEAAEEQDAARINAERERKRKERERREKERLDRILDKAEKVAERRGELFQGIASRSGSRAGLRALALRGVEKTLADLKSSEDKPMTAKEFRAALLEILRNSNAMREFGSNFFPDSDMGRVATHTSVQTDILMEMSRQQGVLIRGQWHPGAWYAGNELAVTGTGVGY